MPSVKKQLTNGIQSMGYTKQSRRRKFRLNRALNFRISFDVNTARGLILIQNKWGLKVSLKKEKLWTNQDYDTAIFDQSSGQGKELFLASTVVGSCKKFQLSYKTWRFTYVRPSSPTTESKLNLASTVESTGPSFGSNQARWRTCMTSASVRRLWGSLQKQWTNQKRKNLNKL